MLAHHGSQGQSNVYALRQSGHDVPAGYRESAEAAAPPTSSREARREGQGGAKLKRVEEDKWDSANTKRPKVRPHTGQGHGRISHTSPAHGKISHTFAHYIHPHRSFLKWLGNGTAGYKKPALWLSLPTRSGTNDWCCLSRLSCSPSKACV